MLSGDQLVLIAEKENKSNLNGLCDLLFGFTDLLSLMLIFLPLYSKPVDGYIYSVSLIEYVDNEHICSDAGTQTTSGWGCRSKQSF